MNKKTEVETKAGLRRNNGAHWTQRTTRYWSNSRPAQTWADAVKNGNEESFLKREGEGD